MSASATRTHHRHVCSLPILNWPRPRSPTRGSPLHLMERPLSTTILMRELATAISPHSRPNHASPPPRRSQISSFAAIKSP